MGEDLKPAMPNFPEVSADLPPPAFSHQLIIGKALLNSPPAKQTSASQQALASFLAKKRERYKSKLNNSLDSRLQTNGAQRSNRASPPTHVLVSYSSPFELTSSPQKDACLDHLHESKCTLRIASLDSQTLYSHNNKAKSEKLAQRSPQKDIDRGLNTSIDFVKLGSEELADRVVSGARLRRRNRKKSNSIIQREVLRPLIKLHHERPTAPPFRTSTPIPPSSPSSSTPSKSPLKRERRASHSVLRSDEVTRRTRSKSLGLSKSLDELHSTGNSLQSTRTMAAKRVIFQSEKQSATPKDTGIPSVPPSTPRAGKA